ncbi:hypothetical protein CDCA_CDCA20G4789 [Cyanidium caldarium]|uniref:Uncharacterized protein n=1 Tax=Cyanidium caldarium TaxID=2771 RepID=A0AAV9J2I4_CYACA|nr:hypothetical protein CDCA_CDCA20G4789 [Cyanidium caldarium]
MGVLNRTMRRIKAPRNLFRSLRACRIEWDPFDDRSTAARELLRQLSGKRVRQGNPDLRLETIMQDGQRAEAVARVHLEFVTGEKRVLDASGMTFRDVRDEIAAVAMKDPTRWMKES